jgi:hypothetical protein
MRSSKNFPYLECWRILRIVPRWTELSCILRKNTPLVDRTNCASVEQTLGDSGGTDTRGGEMQSPPMPDFTLKRPPGNRKAKDAAKNESFKTIR